MNSRKMVIKQASKCLEKMKVYHERFQKLEEKLQILKPLGYKSHNCLVYVALLKQKNSKN